MEDKHLKQAIKRAKKLKEKLYDDMQAALVDLNEETSRCAYSLDIIDAITGIPVVPGINSNPKLCKSLHSFVTSTMLSVRNHKIFNVVNVVTLLDYKNEILNTIGFINESYMFVYEYKYLDTLPTEFQPAAGKVFEKINGKNFVIPFTKKDNIKFEPVISNFSESIQKKIINFYNNVGKGLLSVDLISKISMKPVTEGVNPIEKVRGITTSLFSHSQTEIIGESRIVNVDQIAIQSFPEMILINPTHKYYTISLIHLKYINEYAYRFEFNRFRNSLENIYEKKTPFIDSDKVFIIEDDEPLTKLIAYSLKEEPYDITIFHTAEEALKVIKSKNLIPDIIILDVDLPEMDGYEFAKIIKNNDLTKHVGIMFITGLADGVHRKDGFKFADACIQKPFDLKDMHWDMEAILRQKKEMKDLHSKLISK